MEGGSGLHGGHSSLHCLVGMQPCPDLGKKGGSNDCLLSLQDEKGTETWKKMRGNQVEREKDKEQEKAQGGGIVKEKGEDNEGRTNLQRGRLWMRWEQFLQRKRGGCRTSINRAGGERGWLWECSLRVWEGVYGGCLPQALICVLSARICSNGSGL